MRVSLAVCGTFWIPSEAMGGACWGISFCFRSGRLVQLRSYHLVWLVLYYYGHVSVLLNVQQAFAQLWYEALFSEFLRFRRLSSYHEYHLYREGCDPQVGW